MSIKILFFLLACTPLCNGSLVTVCTANTQARLTLNAWIELAKTEETVALTLLSQQSHLLKNTAFLASTLLHNPDVAFIKNLIYEYCFFLNKEHFKQAFIMAARLGSSNIFDLLCETHNLDAKSFLHCIVHARIIASSQHYHFVHNILHYLAFIRSNIVRNHEKGTSCTRCTTTCSYQLSLSDLTIPASKKQLTSLWDEETKEWVDHCTKSHTYALQAAIDADQIAIATLLLMRGAPFGQKDHDGDTAITLAARRQLTAIIPMLKLYTIWHERLVKETELPKGISENLLCKLIIACPALASYLLKDSLGNLLLHKAIKSGFWQLAIMLLAREPDAIGIVNRAGLSPLACAVSKSTVLKKLVEYAYSLRKSQQIVVVKENK